MRAAVAIAALLAVSATATAKPAEPELRDARYCEVLELRGAIPDARIDVWNTIGLSDCPQRRWEELDAAELASRSGASLVVLNGPRHFLMDSAEARIGTRVRTFGRLRMRRVATIPIDEVADLARAPYAERTIERINTWTWERGRRVHELLAPGGARYVMQSYSLASDPEQDIDDLRTLGDRLEPPAGWRFRTRRLRADLTLAAKGGAVVVQDELQNTYQRVPGGRR